MYLIGWNMKSAADGFSPRLSTAGVHEQSGPQNWTSQLLGSARVQGPAWSQVLTNVHSVTEAGAV